MCKVLSLFGASVAQLVEQLTLNQLVSGSSPDRGTIFFRVAASFQRSQSGFPESALIRKYMWRPRLLGK
jgi:hypothetical protein